MAQIEFSPIDTPMLEETNFGPNAKRWLTTLVDKLNSNFLKLNEAFDNLYLLSGAKTNIGGLGAGPINVVVTGLTSSDYVTVTLVSSTNPSNVLYVVPGAGSFDITFSTDPGASAIIVYQVFAKQPQ